MKKTIKLAVVAALALGATSAFATNGDVMIGQGAKSRSMGGVGIAKSFGAESGLANPAMLKSIEKSEAVLVVTAFAPSVSFNSDVGAKANGQTNTTYADSEADLSVIPEIAYATRINDNTVIGLSVSGTAGMGTDYGDVPWQVAGDNGGFQMKTELALLKVAVPVSHTIGNLTVGLAAVMQYGSLQMSHQFDSDQNMSNGGFSTLDNGASSDIGLGIEVGAAYDMKNGLTLGAIYKSKIAMTYDNTISASIDKFGGAAATGVASGDNLEQPKEIGIGFSYENGASTIAADYKNIRYGDAAGYSDFGWENQDVYVLGYEYVAKAWALRLGYNYASNPIVEQIATKGFTGSNVTNYGGAVKNFFNLSGFPGVVETHYTIGGSYNISDSLSIDGALIYVPEVTFSYDTSAMTQAFIAGAAGGAAAGATTATSSANVKHSQMGLTLAASYRF